MTRFVTAKPNGDAPERDYVHVVLPGTPVVFMVIFEWGEAQQVVGTHHRRKRYRDYLGRDMDYSVQAITRVRWDSCDPDRGWTPMVEKVVMEAERMREAAHPVVEKVARLLTLEDA